MILTICCPHCRHRGAVPAILLPATLRCWRCHMRSVFKDGAEVRPRKTTMLHREVLSTPPSSCSRDAPCRERARGWAWVKCARTNN
jgi:hypothetical protein